MKIETKQFGSIEIDSGRIFTMQDGMPGFQGMKRFVVIDREETWPFQCYQCLDDAGLCFFIMNPYLFKADYTVDTVQAVREAGWEGDGPEAVKLYVIVNTSSGIPEKITANLIGPLLINTRRFEAIQFVIPNSRYSHQHLIFSSMVDNVPAGGKAVSA